MQYLGRALLRLVLVPVQMLCAGILLNSFYSAQGLLAVLLGVVFVIACAMAAAALMMEGK